MFAKYVYETASAEYEDRILLIDHDHIEERYPYTGLFTTNGFEIIHYVDDLDLRVNHPEAMLKGKKKFLILADPEQYIPYDVRCAYHVVELSYTALFPKLNSVVLLQETTVSLGLLTMAYQELFGRLSSEEQTRDFIKEKVYGKTNVSNYLSEIEKKIRSLANSASDYKDWFEISELKARGQVLSAQYDAAFDVEDVQDIFKDYVVEHFGQLASKLDQKSPVLVSRIMEFIHDRSDRFAIIVMDGMSQFDWDIMEKYFQTINYEKSNVCAMIPTTTSISRQCVLSNKFPYQLLSPWKQDKEKNEFIECARNLGYSNQQIAYERGYDADFKSIVKCAAVIINDIDDMVHGQKQGRVGMYHDINLLAKGDLLQGLVRRLLGKGFDIYITADHGNVPCTGIGKLMKTGVEVETKSRRMLVLKDFADKESLIEKHGMIEYPKYYLDPTYDYLTCDTDKSFDAKGEQVMTHGGITIDEVIVPFITIKAVDNNG